MRYQPMPGGKFLVLAMFGVFGVAAVFLATASLSGGDGAPPPLFTAFWLAALAWNGYWFLFRFAVRLTLHADSIIAEMPLGRRVVPVNEIVAIRPMKLASNAAVFEVSDQRPVLTLATKGFREFAAAVVAVRPELPMRLGWQARLAARMPGRSRVTRR